MGKEQCTVITPVFRANFPQLFKAKMNDLSKKEEFSVIALFKKGEDLKALKDAAKAACELKWGPDAKKWPQIRPLFRDQAEKAKDVDGKRVLPGGYEEGAQWMTLKSTKRPGLVDRNRQEILDPAAVYSGCYLRAQVFAQAYDNGGNRGVSFYLNHVQKMDDGEPLSGRTSPEEAFAAVGGGVDAPAGAPVSAASMFD